MQKDQSHTQEMAAPENENWLKAAGYGYLIGDAALFASGMLSGRTKEAMSGLLYGVGGLVLARYGNPSAEKRLQLLSHDLKDYLVNQGVAIPQGAELTRDKLTAKDGPLDAVERFLYRYPSQVLNGLYFAGATQMIQSGIQYRKPWDTASGALIAAGGLAGLLLPEQKPEEGKKPEGLIAWLKEKPLRVSGAFYMANNAALIMSAMKERRIDPSHPGYMFKFLTAASYIMANGLLTLCSKDNVGTTNEKEKAEALHKLTRASAEVIAAQPVQVRDALTQQVAGFLSGQPGIGKSADELVALMQQELGVAAKQTPSTGWQQSVAHTGDLSPSL